MGKLLKIKLGQFVARRSLVQYLEDRGYKVLGVVKVGYTYVFDLLFKGKKYSLTGELGALKVDSSLDSESANYRDKFVRGNEVFKIGKLEVA